MKRLITCLVATLIVSLFSFTGFAIAGTEITLIMPSHEADILGYFEKEAVEFERQTGIKVNVVSADWDHVADKVLPALAAGSSAYDIVEFDNCWVAQFAETGWLRPLETYAGEEYIKGMLPGLVNLFSAKGHLYGITWNNDLRLFMYNARMLRQAGIGAPPATWSEFVEQSRRLQAVGIAKYGYIANWEKGQALTNDHTVMVRSFGGRILDGNGNPVLDSPETVAALQFMVDMLYKYRIADPASLTSSQKAAQEVFLREDTAFFPQAWAGLYAYSRNPEVSRIVGEVEVASRPLGVSKDKVYRGSVLSLPEALAIPTTSKHPDEAWAFLKFISNKEANKAQSLVIGSLPIWTDLFNDPELLRKYPYWKQFGLQGRYLEGLPPVTWYGELSEIQSVEVMNALTRLKTVEQATRDMMKKIKAIEK